MEPEVLAELRAAAGRAFATHPVRFAYLFGSQVSGRPGPESDIDVAVQLADDVPTERYLAVRLELSRRLSDAGAPGPLDVVVLNSLPLPLRGRVVANHRVIYSIDEPARVELESRVAREFEDFQIAFRGLDRELLAAIASGQR